MRLPDTSRLLETLTAHRARFFQRDVTEVALAAALGQTHRRLVAEARLDDTVRETMAMAEVHGATVALREAASASQDGSASFGADTANVLRFANEGQAIIPNATLPQAIADMVERTPVTLQPAAERAGARIARLYSSDRVVAFARAMNEHATERGRKVILAGLQKGITELDAGKVLAEINDWSESYSRMAFRTNVGTAVTAGRFRQALDPAVRAVTPAFRFDSVGDSDTRDNHDAADGRIWAVDNPVWRTLAPPLGYNCRCQASLVSVMQLRREGLIAADGSVRESAIPFNARPDEGFRPSGRSDLFIV